jgi:hypothetical protein
MDKKFKNILPSFTSRVEANVVVTEPPTGDPARRRRPLGGAACGHCRAKKYAVREVARSSSSPSALKLTSRYTNQCGGQRPSCEGCLKRGILCNYRPAKRKNAEGLLLRHEKFVHHLRTLPEAEAIDLMRSLRSAADPEIFLDFFEAGQASLLQRPSDLGNARWTGPPTETATEFELMTRHQAVYLKVDPVGRSFLEHLVDISWPPARFSRRTGTSSPPDGFASGDQSSDAEVASLGQPQGISRGTVSFPQPIAYPSAPEQLCDERLGKMQINYWTRVPVTNALAAAALSHYLEKDHLVMDFFDADVVLDDLVTCRPRFCTPFLFSSLMFVAFVSPTQKLLCLIGHYLTPTVAVVYPYRHESSIFGC